MSDGYHHNLWTIVPFLMFLFSTFKLWDISSSTDPHRWLICSTNVYHLHFLVIISLVVSVNSLTGRLNQSKEAHHNSTSIQFLHPHTSATVRWSNEYYKRSLTCHILIEYLTIWSSSHTETLPRCCVLLSLLIKKGLAKNVESAGKLL